METVTINVTQEMIDSGQQHSCKSCPIALAIRAAGYPNAFVSYCFWQPRPFENSYFPLPQEVQNFIANFDTCRPVSPATFVLPLTPIQEHQ